MTKSKVKEIYNAVLFLDIDGVLSSEEYASRYTIEEWEKLSYLERHIDSKAVELINYICSETNADIVISSTWRYGRTVEQLQEVLNQRGCAFKVIGKTPEHDIRYRGYEIDTWISKNRSRDKKKLLKLQREIDRNVKSIYNSQ